VIQAHSTKRLPKKKKLIKEGGEKESETTETCLQKKKGEIEIPVNNAVRSCGRLRGTTTARGGKQPYKRTWGKGEREVGWKMDKRRKKWTETKAELNRLGPEIPRITQRSVKSPKRDGKIGQKPLKQNKQWVNQGKKMQSGNITKKLGRKGRKGKGEKTLNRAKKGRT